MSQFESKMRNLNKKLQGECDTFLFVCKSKEGMNVQINGTPFELLTMTRSLVESMRKEFSDNLPAPLVEKLLQGIIKTDDELQGEIEEYGKRQSVLPSWLRALLFANEDSEDDDACDESDDCDDESDEEEVDEAEEKAHKEALEKFFNALRDSGAFGNNGNHPDNANRSDD